MGWGAQGGQTIGKKNGQTTERGGGHNRLIDNGRACNPKLRLELETSDFEQYVLRDAIRNKFEVVQ